MTRSSWQPLGLILVAVLGVLTGCGSGRPAAVEVTGAAGWDSSDLAALAASDAASTQAPAAGDPSPVTPGGQPPTPIGSIPPGQVLTGPTALPAASAAATRATGGLPHPAAGPAVKATAAGSQAPAPAPARGVTAPAQAVDDVRYAPTAARQTLDLLLPARTGRAVPLVIVVHGGAFLSGDKTDEAATAQALVGRGYAAASVNYRYSSQATFPAAVQDVKAAVRWLRAHAAHYGIDPGRFGIWGSSAGGYLAAMVGVTSGRATSLDDPALGNPGVSSAVQAVVDWYGPIDFGSMDAQTVSPGGCPGTPDQHGGPGSPESLFLGAAVQTVPGLVATANPITYLAHPVRLPPFAVAHGTADCNVPYGQSVQLAAALKAAGGQVSVSLLDGIGHGGEAFVPGRLPAALDFLDSALRG